jgi:pilus assembly protein CpaF
VADLEARGFSKPERDRLVDEVLRELFGYGPLEELFAEAAVREVMVVGPTAVIVRRDLGQWLPTSVTFRDEAHLRATLDRIATHAEPVGPVMASMTLFDVRLPNGFRAVALIPPDALEQAAMVSFIREQTVPLPPVAGAAPVPAVPEPRHSRPPAARGDHRVPAPGQWRGPRPGPAERSSRRSAGPAPRSDHGAADR